MFDGTTEIGTAHVGANGDWTFTKSALSDGSHTFTATDVNASGQSSVASSALAVTIDTHAPAAPTIDAFSQSGSSIGSTTSVSDLVLKGTAEAGSTIKVFDGSTQIGTATANSSGAWSLDTGALGTGLQQFTATATDVAGNTSTSSSPLGVTIAGSTSSGQTGATGTPQLPDLFGGYSVRPPWQVAGVDYAVGVPAGTALKDPSVAGNLPPGVTLDTVNHVVNILGNNVTLNGFDFSAGGGWTVNIEAGTTGTTTIENCNFSLNANQPIAINASSENVGNLTVQNCSINGNQENIPSVLPPPSGTGLGAAINYDGNGTFIAKANYIHDMPADGIDLGSGTVTPTIEYNVFEGLGYTPGSHPDPVQFVGDVVNNAIIAYNTIYQPQGVEPNEGLAVQAQLGSTITNTTIANNVIIATGPNMSISLNIGLFQDFGNVLNGVTVANNYVDPTGTFTSTGFGDLPSEVQGSNLTISNNINLLTGKTTAPTAGTFSTANVANLPDDPPTSTGSSSPPPAPNAPAITGDTVVGDKVQVSGTAEAGSTVKVYEGSTLLGTTLAGSNGNWSLTTSTLSQGTHTLDATATDTAGTSAASQSVQLVVSSTTGTGGSTGSGSTGGTVPKAPAITADTVVQNKVEVSGTAEAGSTVKVYEGSTLLGTTLAGSNGNWSLTTSALSQGTHTLDATATDTAGTSAASQSVQLVVSSTTGTGGSTGSGSTGGTVPKAPAITADTVVQNKVEVSGTAEAGSTVKVYEGSTLLGTTLAGSNGNWSLTTSALSQGTHTLDATATDTAGTSAASQSVQLVVSSTTGTGGSTGSGSTGGTVPKAPAITADTVVQNKVEVSGTAEAGSTVKVYEGSTLLGTTRAGSNGNWSLTTSALSQGTHTLDATATDTAGTSAASQSVQLVVSSTTGTGGSTGSGSTGGTVPKAPAITADTVVYNKVKVSGTAEAGSTVKVYEGSTLLGTTRAGSNGNWSLTTSALSRGTHTLDATATDAAGTSTASQSFAAVIGSNGTGHHGSSPSHPADTTPPAAPVITEDTVVHHNKVEVSGTAEAGSTIKVYEGSALVGTTQAAADGDWSLTTSSLANGAHTFVATATDAAGNTSGFSQPLDPVIGSAGSSGGSTSGPGDTSGSSGTTLQFTGAHQNQHGTITLTGTAESGSKLEIYDGTKAVGSVTTDSDGNWSFKAFDFPNKVHTFTADQVDSTGDSVATTSGAVVVGSNGNDTLVGTSGNDVMSGKGGGDTFVFAPNFGDDVIADFAAQGSGHDTIDFSKSVFNSFASVLAHANQAGNDVVISAGSDTLTLKNIKISALNSHDFQFHNGAS